jgi:hypothetical protein
LRAISTSAAVHGWDKQLYQHREHKASDVCKNSGFASRPSHPIHHVLCTELTEPSLDRLHDVLFDNQTAKSITSSTEIDCIMMEFFARKYSGFVAYLTSP